MESTDRNAQLALKKLTDAPQSFELSQAFLVAQAVFLSGQHQEKDFWLAFLKLKVSPSLQFAASPIVAVEQSDTELIMHLSCLGLLGTQGVLTEAYPALKPNSVFANFIAAFEHRFQVLLQQAAFSDLLAFKQVQGRFHTFIQSVALSLLPEASHFASSFIDQNRSGQAYVRLLQYYFNLPVRLHSLRGGFERLPDGELSRLNDNSPHNRLGCGFVIGRRVFLPASTLTCEVGPVDYSQILCWRTGGAALAEFIKITQAYFQGRVKIKLKLVIATDSVPVFVLSSRANKHLSRNAYLI
jgi:predicted component of type VI protein secretion system